jgi:hypothetical protein
MSGVRQAALCEWRRTTPPRRRAKRKARKLLLRVRLFAVAHTLVLTQVNGPDATDCHIH